MSTPKAKFSLCQNKIIKILKHPVVLQGIVNNAQILSRYSDLRFSVSASGFDLLVIFFQVWVITNRHQRALHQCGSSHFTAALGDETVKFFRTRNSRYSLYF